MSLEGREITVHEDGSYSENRTRKVYDLDFVNHVDYNSHFDKLLRVKGLRTASDAQMYRLAMYDEDMQIFSHSSDKDPASLKLVEMHDAEKTVSPLKERLNDFMRNEVYKNLGISFNEFISFPRHIQAIILEAVDKERAAKLRETEEATKNAQKELNLGNG